MKRSQNGDGSNSNAMALPPAGKVTVRQVVEWFRARNPGKAKVCAEHHVERNRIWAAFVDLWGDRRCVDGKPFWVEDFILSQPKVKENWTRRRWSVILQTPFNQAAKLGVIDRNPFKGVDFPLGKRGRDWTPEEFRRLLKISRPAFRRFLCAIRFSGMRPGEVRSLIWSWVDPEKKCIIIPAEKSKNRVRRLIPFNAVLVRLLCYCRRHNPDSEYVFLNNVGKAMTRGAAECYMRRVRIKAGLPTTLKLHGGRHMFATVAIMNGVDVATLAQLLGHADLNTTQIYLHLSNKVDHLLSAMTSAIGGNAVLPLPPVAPSPPAVNPDMAALAAKVEALTAAMQMLINGKMAADERKPGAA